MLPAPRPIVVLLSVLCMVLSTQGSLVVLTLFQLRRESIARHHCENRFEPASTCNGLCFLKDRLAEAGHEEQEEAPLSVSQTLLFFLPAAAPFEPVRPARAARLGTGCDERCALPGHRRVPDPPPRRS